MGRISLLVTMALAFAPGDGFAQNPEDIRVLLRRVQLEPERELADSLDEADENIALAAARVVASLGGSGFAFPQQTLACDLFDRVGAGRFDNALAEYRQLLQDNEKELALPGIREIGGTETMTSRDTRATLLRRIARLPASMVERYRRSVEAEASRLLAEGEATRSPLPLHRLLRDFTPTVQAEKAAALLGDLAFERGAFDEALIFWRRLTPLPTKTRAGLREGDSAFPQPMIDLARLQAKQILALLFNHQARQAERELQAFRELHPQAQGTLAGRTDTYHAILAHWLQERRPFDNEDRELPWPTFGGTASRNRRLTVAPTDRLWIDGPAWTLPLLPPTKAPASTWLSATKSLAIPPTPYHPIIVEGQLLINDGYLIAAYELLTGKPLYQYSRLLPNEVPDNSAHESATAYTLSASRGKVFGRVWRERGNPRSSRLICLELERTQSPRNHFLWDVEPTTPDRLPAIFDTDPLVDDDQVLIGLSRSAEGKTTSYLAAFDLDGTPRWTTKLAEYPEEAEGHRPRPQLLIKAGELIVQVTHAGVVVAVEPITGRRLWAIRYPTVDSESSPRELSSCLAADGRLYLAPLDSPNLFCLDADTGRVLWERPWKRPPTDIVPGGQKASEVVQFFGVADDRLVFTDRYRLNSLDTQTGNRLAWQQPSVGKLPGMGRGLLAGSWAFWPTADPRLSWRTVTLTDGLLRQPDEESGDPEYYDPTALRSLPAGNVIFGQGCLAIAGPKELAVFVPLARQFSRLQHDASLPNVKPETLYRLALANLERGESSALTLAELVKSVPTSHQSAWLALVEERTNPQRTSSPPPGQNVKTKPDVPRSPRPRNPTPSIEKLEPAWGPIPGFAPPLHPSQTPERDNVMVLRQGRDLVALDPHTGGELFRRSLGTRPIDWLGRHDSIVIAAGPWGIEGFDWQTGTRAWSWPAPGLAAARWLLVDGTPHHVAPDRPLEGIRFIGNRLAVFEGQRRVLLLDPASGQVTQEAWADGGEIAPLEGGLLQPFLRNEDTGAGDMPLSARIESVANERGVWSLDEITTRSARVDERHRLVGQPSGRVVLRDDVADKIVWTYEPPWPTSLTGAAAQVMARDAVLMVLIPRNHGNELIRLDRDKRQPLWTLAPHLLSDGFDVRHALLEERALYFVHRGTMQALDLADGRILWKRALPPLSGPWHVDRLGDRLLVWSQVANGIPALSGPGNPLLAPVALMVGRRGLGQVPIFVIDPTDGAVRQRLDVPHDHGPVFVNIHRSTVIVTASGQVRAWTAK